MNDSPVERAMARAQMAGKSATPARTEPSPARASASLIRDFFVSLPELTDDDLRQAEEYLLRLRSLSTDSRYLADMGRQLWQLAFPDRQANERFADALASVTREGGKLRVWIEARSHRLAALPWEYLCMDDAALSAYRTYGLAIPRHEVNQYGQSLTDLPNPDTFIGLHPNILLLRQAGTELRDRIKDQIGSLRVLIVCADPRSNLTDPKREGWEPIDGVLEEARAVRERLETRGPSQVMVDVLEAATRDSFRAKVRAFRPQVLHFIGHGAFSDPESAEWLRREVRTPSLVLEGRHTATRRRHDYLTAGELRELCRECCVRVVILNSCEGGRADPQLTGMAQSLMQQDTEEPVPVVVAMQTRIPQTTALLFSDWIYQSLTNGNSFEFAFQQFRTDYIYSHNLGDGFWGIPVLYSSARSTVLFDRHISRHEPLAAEPPVRDYDRFIGRDFLGRQIDEFLSSEPSGYFLLTGPTGIGKSAFLSNWVGLHGNRTHFFYCYSAHDSPIQCARSLYSAIHQMRCPDFQFDPPDRLEDACEKLQKLLEEVSRRLVRREREIIVLDGLDEANAASPDQAVPLPDALPQGVYVLLAARPEWLERHPRRELFHHYPLDPLSEENLRDGAEFLAAGLEYNEIQAPASLCANIARQVEGNFLLLKLLCDILPITAGAGQLRLVDYDIMPVPVEPRGVEDMADRWAELITQLRSRQIVHGDLNADNIMVVGDRPFLISDAYAHYWRQLGGQCSREELQFIDDLLGLLFAAAEPVSQEQLAAALRSSLPDCQRTLRHIRRFLATSLLGEDAIALRFFHASFREFGQSRVGRDLRGYHQLWAEHCLGWRELTGHARAYALRHLPTHLIEASKS